ncbi:hypothetical protein [Parasitella parasitica]|uniref:UspA domain-containing protein n=1 Tax=Parasitella parasitica TaxID=35722 RepID=A0A0B7N938_9FUNG|nr:hypothetical protein [Parasitella parasitica]
MSNTVSIPTPDSIAPRRIVICYDESEASRQTLEWVNSHRVLLPTDEIYIATCINEDVAKIEGHGGWQTIAIGGIDCAADYRRTIQSLESQGRERLAEAVGAMRALGLKHVKAEILRGVATSEITKFAKEKQADLVICGSRGLGYLKRKLIGSTSEHLVHHLDCTVMVVRSHPDNSKN